MILRGWKAEPKGKRWSVIGYEISSGSFTASFKYPEVDVENMDDDRREDALRGRYGDKLVVYPSFPEGAVEWKS